MFFVRKASSQDYLDIANIHFTSWQAAYSGLLPKSYIRKNNLSEKITLWQQLLSHPNVMVWIAYDDKHNNLGFIGYFANNNNSYEITTLYILPQHHNSGIGSALMEVSLQHLSNSNANTHFYLWVLKTNLNAINFYKKHGFIVSGKEHEEHYKDVKIIDLEMIKCNKDGQQL